MVDTRGDVVAVNNKDPQGKSINSQFLFEKNYSKSAWFKALSNGEFTTKQPFTAPGNDTWTGTYIEEAHIDSAPVYGQNGEVVGYWTNRTSMRGIEEMFQETYQTMKYLGFPGSEVTLLDAQGRVLVDFDPTSHGTEEVSRNFDSLLKLNLAEKGVKAAQEAVAGKSGSLTATHARKQIDQVSGYTHLIGANGFPGMNWAILVRVPESEALADANSVQNSVMQTAFICLALIAPIGWLVGRKGATNLVKVCDVAQKAADGDLTHRADLTSKDELGQLAGAFNAMMDNLTKVVGEVRQGAEHVSTGSAEITQGNEDLSNRTSQAASALEETSASMEEMTSTIKQNADNAKQANQLAVAAREVAEKGGSVTEKAVDAMSEINKSSKKIADIINVIDEIAFQTNLLALNAAVEAARAGEQGRGFAVVASEVRNLAGRSATAAKEIKTLINESVQKVSDGSDLVNQSGQTLEEIVNSVKRVTDIIAEISAASQEQAAGIDQVNKAVIQMDQSTQQNAALVEETTSASQSMRQQAGELLEQVAFFKTEEEQAGGGALANQGVKSPSGRAVNVQSQSPKVATVTRTPQKPVSKPSPTSAKTAPQSAGVAVGNGHERRQGDDDFFEEF
ncbi:MAG: methyl-accepting chemotaxis protein [Nitrospirales bacterium]